MSVIRSDVQDFFVDVTLLGGATFANTGGGTLPAPGNLTVTGGAGVFAISQVSGGTNGSTTVRFFVDITTSMDVLGNLSFAVLGWGIKDPTNVIGGGGNYGISITTFDAATNAPFDTGNDSGTLLVGAFGVAVGTLSPTTAVVDVATNRKNFLATPPDTLTVDNGATLGFDNSVAIGGTVYALNGTAYTLINASRINLIIAGDLSGITNVTWNPGGLFGGAVYSHNVSAAEVTAGTFTIALAGDDPAITDPNNVPIAITVNGTTVLNVRTLTIAANLVLTGGIDGLVANNRALFAPSTLTQWTVNGTVLVANFANGNNAFWNSRFYLWNPSGATGAVTIRVFTLPVPGGGPNVQVGNTVTLGAVMAPTTGLNVRLAEDILTPAGVTLPYVTDNGNVVVEFTINAANVSGFTQVFGPAGYLGVSNMTKVQ
jgi:hypothetical protein